MYSKWPNNTIAMPDPMTQGKEIYTTNMRWIELTEDNVDLIIENLNEEIRISLLCANWEMSIDELNQLLDKNKTELNKKIKEPLKDIKEV